MKTYCIAVVLGLFLLAGCRPTTEEVTPVPTQPASFLPSTTPAPATTVPAASTPTPPPATATNLPPTLAASQGPFPTLYNLRLFDDRIAWAFTNDDGRILRSQDGGVTWQAWSLGSTGQRVASVTFLDALSAWALAGSSDDPGKGQIFRTLDGGQTWKVFPTPFGRGILQFNDGKSGWSMANQDCGAGNCYIQLFQTEDGGQSWSLLKINNPNGSQETFPPGFPPETIHIISGDSFKFQDTGAGGPSIWLGGNSIVSCNDGAILYHSRDGGQTWKEQKLPLPAKVLDPGGPCPVSLPTFLNAREGYLTVQYYLTSQNGVNGSSLAIYGTQNGGETWNLLPAQVAGMHWDRPVVFVTPKDGFTSCGEALCTTGDGGKTWNALSSGLHLNLNEGSNALIAFDFCSPSAGLANLTGPGESTLLFRTADGGHTWDQLEPVILTTP